MVKLNKALGRPFFFFFIRFRGLDDVYDLMIRDKGSFNSKASSYSLFSMAGYHQP